MAINKRSQHPKAWRWLAMVGVLLLVGAGALAVTPPPIILKASDGVIAGRSFSVNGQWFYPTGGLAVALAPDTTGQSPATPPVNALYPAILQTDANAHFIVATLPAGLSAGVYDLWVSNSAGWSGCWKMNAARALFMSDYEAFSGIDIEVVGRNFDQSEFGGVTAAQARLNNGSGAIYSLPVKAVNPYHLTFTVGNQPLGTYFVEVSGDNGVNWSRLASGQTLTVVAVPPGNFDPLGLGVVWAKDFAWTNVYNVTNYGVNPASTADCTTEVQSAMNAAENAGGGVVYFPNGTYYVKSLNLGAGVVLEGQDQYNTKIYYNGTGKFAWIGSKGSGSVGGTAQLQGIARLSLLLSNNSSTNARPDEFIVFGDTAISFSDESIRKANRMFVTSVNLSYPYTNGDPHGADSLRGLAILVVGKERVLLKDNQFTGFEASLGGDGGTYVNQYFILKNNRMEYACGYVHDTANYLFYENNYVLIHPEYGQDCHGYFTRSEAYLANNYVQGAGSIFTNNSNDGEAISTEAPNSYSDYGAVLSATTNSLTVTPIVPLTTPVLYFGTLSVAITEGTGLGQVVTVASNIVAHVNTNTGVITLSQSFVVVPDTTSKFVLFAPMMYWTAYSNTMVNCAKGIELMGNHYDSVIANNTTIDCFGIFVWSCRSGPPNNTNTWTTGFWGDHPDSFVRVTRNTVIGISRRSNQAGIGTYTGRFDNPNFYDVEFYGAEITDNTVFGNNKIAAGTGTEAPYYDGLYVSSYPYSTLGNGSGTGDATETMMESNQLSNLPTGVVLTRCDYGSWVNTNTYDSSVLTFLTNSTLSTDDTLIGSNTLKTGMAAPVIGAQPQNQGVLADGTATFIVLAAGNPAPYYQWCTNNVPIDAGPTGSNGASYTTPPEGLGANGLQFSVVVSNFVGSVTSSIAVLTVVAAPVAPVITNSAQSQTVSNGGSATFAVGASGIPYVTYQWQTNGVNIPGAASSSYTTGPVTAADNGMSFQCVVANSAGSVTSSPAVLGVLASPGFSGLTASQSVSYGTTNLALGGTVSAVGPVYPAIGETISVTINGNAQMTTISDSTGDFSLNYNPTGIPASGATWPITYAYGGDAALSSASDSSTALTVNARPVILSGSQTYNGTTNAAAANLLVANKVGSDAVTAVSGSAWLAGAGGGTEAITAPGTLVLGGAQGTNYTLNGASGSMTVSALAVTLTGTRTYDGTASAQAAILTVVNNHDGTNLSLSGSAMLAGPSVGVQAIIDASGLTLGGTALANYTLNGATGSVTITNQAILITSSSVDVTGTNFVVCWASVPGVVYSVLTNSNLIAPPATWPTAATITATSTTTCFTLPAGIVAGTSEFVIIRQ